MIGARWAVFDGGVRFIVVNGILLKPCLWQPFWYNELYAFLKLNFSQNCLPFECPSAFQPALQDTTKSELVVVNELLFTERLNESLPLREMSSIARTNHLLPLPPPVSRSTMPNSTVASLPSNKPTDFSVRSSIIVVPEHVKHGGKTGTVRGHTDKYVKVAFKDDKNRETRISPKFLISDATRSNDSTKTGFRQWICQCVLLLMILLVK